MKEPAKYSAWLYPLGWELNKEFPILQTFDKYTDSKIFHIEVKAADQDIKS